MAFTMKKLFQHAGKKHKKQSGQPPQVLAEKTDEIDIRFAEEVIETDTVGDLEPPSLLKAKSQLYRNVLPIPVMRKDHGTSQSKDSSSVETRFPRISSPSSYRSRDSGISVTSTASSVESMSWYNNSDLHTSVDECSKHPMHNQFIPITTLNANHFPEEFRDSRWSKLIKLKAMDVVRLSVSYTSENRPDELGFKGVKTVRFGTGTAFPHNIAMAENCDCNAGKSGHSVSGVFRVLTASHVVFDDDEAKSTTVDFFYDSTDSSKIVRGWGLRVCSVDVVKNRSIIECRTHDLDLYRTLKSAQRDRNELIEKELEQEVGGAQIVVLISHPHGKCKQVSLGRLKEQKILGDVRTTKEGLKLVDCLLTYDTSSCPGSGGAPVNVLGGGTASYAFAPHCATKGSGDNISGLGWARVITR